MSEEEYDGLFALLDEEGKDCNLTVLFDIAYIAFFHIPNRKCALIDKLLEKKHSFMPLIAFSCSKVFGLYGLRVGAFIALPSDKDESEEISRAFGAEARGTYSVPNGLYSTASARFSKMRRTWKNSKTKSISIRWNWQEEAKSFFQV